MILDDDFYDPVKFEIEFNANKEKYINNKIQTKISPKINKDINYNFVKKNNDIDDL